jgi:hypothetical protein
VENGDARRSVGDHRPGLIAHKCLSSDALGEQFDQLVLAIDPRLMIKVLTIEPCNHFIHSIGAALMIKMLAVKSFHNLIRAIDAALVFQVLTIVPRNHFVHSIDAALMFQVCPFQTRFYGFRSPLIFLHPFHGWFQDSAGVV